MLAIERFGLPPALVSALKHLASLHNPTFYEKERLRLSTWNTPRFIRCYQETLDRLVLPRGLLPEVEDLLHKAGSRLSIVDQQSTPDGRDFQLGATLSAPQDDAVTDLAGHEHGVLVAPPGTGKTVIACALIAHHRQPTLVIVDRKPVSRCWTSGVLACSSTSAWQPGRSGNSAADATAPRGSLIWPWCKVSPAATTWRQSGPATGSWSSTSATTCLP